MNQKFDVIIVGGSYSGLSAAMALGRSMRRVLLIDSGKPANRFTPSSHNFITHDGRPPGEIAELARQQVYHYPSVKHIDGIVVRAEKINSEFIVRMNSNVQYVSRKLILATGIVDLLPDIPGFSECWGKSVLHCPYCHGYEVRNTKTGIVGNGDYAFQFASLISNWTSELTIFTNGASTLPDEQFVKLSSHNIQVVQDKIQALHHKHGYLESISFDSGRSSSVSSIYTRPEFKQHSDLATQLGCEMTEDGYIKTDPSQRTTVNGVYACGDNCTAFRTVSNAVSMGTAAGMMVNKEFIMENF